MVKNKQINLDELYQNFEHYIKGIDEFPEQVKKFNDIIKNTKKWKNIERRNQKIEIQNELNDWWCNQEVKGR